MIEQIATGCEIAVVRTQAKSMSECQSDDVLSDSTLYSKALHCGVMK